MCVYQSNDNNKNKNKIAKLFQATYIRTYPTILFIHSSIYAFIYCVKTAYLVKIPRITQRVRALLCFFVVRYGSPSSISSRVTSLALGQSHDDHSELALKIQIYLVHVSQEFGHITATKQNIINLQVLFHGWYSFCNCIVSFCKILPLVYKLSLFTHLFLQHQRSGQVSCP